MDELAHYITFFCTPDFRTLDTSMSQQNYRLLTSLSKDWDYAVKFAKVDYTINDKSVPSCNNKSKKSVRCIFFTT